MPLVVYSPGHDEDLMLTLIYGQIAGEGDQDRCLHGDAKTLGGFFALVREASPCFIALDDNGPYWIGWFEPCMSGAFFGSWCAPNKRKSRDNVRNHLQALKLGLTQYPVIMGITKQEALLDVHRRLGYEIMGFIPKLWDEEAGWLMWINAARVKDTLALYSPLFRQQPDEITALLEEHFGRYSLRS